MGRRTGELPIDRERPSALDGFQPAARTLDEVFERMELIERALTTLDGVAWFNKMYGRVTANVRAALDEGKFRYPKFMQALTIDFANLYFQAVSDDLRQPSKLAKAWVPLFEARHSRSIAPIQFALAGMNAHINRDLALAVVSACAKLRTTPNPRRRRDYDLVTEILAETQDDVKAWFATGFLELVDVSFGEVDDVIAIFSIRKAREAAWMTSQVLWELRKLPPLFAIQVANLDRLVGFAGRGLLVPTAVGVH